LFNFYSYLHSIQYCNRQLEQTHELKALTFMYMFAILVVMTTDVINTMVALD